MSLHNVFGTNRVINELECPQVQILMHFFLLCHVCLDNIKRVSKSAKRQGCMATLIIVCRSKPKLDLGRLVDESNPYIKIGRNGLIND